ncbi:hypothetical protein DFR58_13218 [Anaerobacterium chartisolvens]|uniref:C-deglycosylation enzyme beta subunit n=1 Tax=Anaerobacterium chartisolvens TaxID=1297424 RepID=A0A369AR41_9FIRM|nr:DUF6379 domain-containing protein [Anaerobacterium chartisolvens]RCX09924.1 hypothetical protein DFR58_13218 [Anaerobacterium chartisolvens]
MFENYILTEGSCKNVSKDGKIIGYQMQTQITYYRGIPCSMIHEVKVAADGVEVPREKILFSPDGEDFFTLDELETVTSYKWEFGEKATVFVEQEGGLAPGEHEITLTTSIRTAYIPVPVGGFKTRKVVIA